MPTRRSSRLLSCALVIMVILCLAAPKPAGAGKSYVTAPDYDSDWTAIDQGVPLILNHGLGGNTDDYVVVLDQFSSGYMGWNQMSLGGCTYHSSGVGDNNQTGARWGSLNDTQIRVYRCPNDYFADQVRVRIWVDPYPDYDSGWFSVIAGVVQGLTHDLGGDPGEYVVDLQQRDGPHGVNNWFLGGMDCGTGNSVCSDNDRVGSYW